MPILITYCTVSWLVNYECIPHISMPIGVVLQLDNIRPLGSKIHCYCIPIYHKYYKIVHFCVKC